MDSKNELLAGMLLWGAIGALGYAAVDSILDSRRSLPWF